MSARTRLIAPILAYALLPFFISCQDGPHRWLDDAEFEAKILKDAESVRSRQGERLAGYLAEYEVDFEARRVFLSLEILKYEKGERLSIAGGLSKDTVRVSYGDQPALEVPIVFVRKAGPPGAKTDVDKILSGAEKKR